MFRERKLLGILFALLFITCVSCQEGSEIKLDVANLQQSGEFGWAEFTYGTSMTETESQSGYRFEGVPYRSSRAERMDIDSQEEFDYHTNSDYRYADFPALKNGKPVYVRYQDAVGNLIVEFQEDQLTAAVILFGSEVSRLDDRIDFKNTENDPSAVYSRLEEELRAKYGAPQVEKEGVLSWRSSTEDTQLTISYTADSDCGEVTVLLVGQYPGET